MIYIMITIAIIGLSYMVGYIIGNHNKNIQREQPLTEQQGEWVDFNFSNPVEIKSGAIYRIKLQVIK